MVVSALADKVDIAVCKNSIELYSSLGSGMADAVLLEAFAHTEVPLAGTIATVRQRVPTTPIIVVTELTADQMHSALAIGKAGANDLIVIGHDDYGKILFRSITRRLPVEAVLRLQILPMIRGDAHSAVELFINNLSTGWSVEGLAAAMHISSRSLGRYFHAAHIPPPIKALAWVRIAAAVYLLEQTGAKVGAVPASLGMTSLATLRRQLRDLAGWRISDARCSGAFQRVIDRIESEWNPR